MKVWLVVEGNASLQIIGKLQKKTNVSNLSFFPILFNKPIFYDH